MDTFLSRAVTTVNLVLVLGCLAFAQNGEKPQAAVSAKEKALLAGVTETAQWKPADPRVAKAYRELADFYSSQSRFTDAERTYQKRLEFEEDALGRRNPQIIPAITDLARVNFAQMKYARASELYERSLRIMEREYGEQHQKLVPAIDDAAQVLQAESKD